MNYTESANQVIKDFESQCSPEEFVVFQKDATTFLESIKDKPAFEQSKLFMDKYNHIFMIVRIKTLYDIRDKVRVLFILALLAGLGWLIHYIYVTVSF